MWPSSIQPEKKSPHHHHILATLAPQTWLCILVLLHQLIRGALEQMPGRNHMPTVGQNKSLHQLGDTDSGASILIHPTLPSFGWHHAARNHELINTLQLHKVSCDGGEWKKRRGWGGRGRGRGLSSVHRAAASGINNTAHSSAKYLVFLPLLSASFLIPTQIPANNSVLFPCCHSPYSLHLFPTDISLPQSIKSREKVKLPTLCPSIPSPDTFSQTPFSN